MYIYLISLSERQNLYSVSLYKLILSLNESIKIKHGEVGNTAQLNSVAGSQKVHICPKPLNHVDT